MTDQIKSMTSDEARRQGQFEGTVTATLNEIKNHVADMSRGNIALENRLQQQIDSLRDTVSQLVEYKSTIKGGLIALGVLSPVLSAILTTLVQRWMSK